jgi:plastin-1
MERSELQKVLKDLGHDDLSEEVINTIFEKIDTNTSGKIEYIEFVAMYGLVKEKGLKVVSEAVETIKGVSKRAETSGGHRTYHVEEVSVCTRFINSNLAEDEELNSAGVLPIDPDTEDVFYQMSTGQILIKLLRLADEESIDLRTINKYPNKNIFETKQNLIQALTSAKGIIKLVGINDNAFTEKNPYLILSVLTQLMRVISVKSIDLRNCEELYRLLLPGESIEDLMKLKPEDILIRWVNYHLAKAGQEKRITNLGKDIADGTAMTYVLNQLDKDCSLAPLSGADNVEKCNMMVNESKKIDVKDVASGSDISKGNPKVNTIFVAEVFNTRHGLEELN